MDVDLGTIIWVSATLLGTIIGGFFSWLSSNTNETKRAQRENAKRLEGERRLIYVRLLRVANQLESLKFVNEKVPSTLEIELMSVLSEIEILAPPLTREHALAFGRAISDRFFRLGGRQLPSDAWEDRRRRFIDSIHKELDISVTYPKVGGSELPSIEDLGKGVREAHSNLTTQTQIPLPIALGGVCLLLSYAIPGGLKGWQGFLVGAVVGLIILSYVSIHSRRESAE